MTLGGLLPPDEGQAPRPMCVDMPPLLHTLRLRTGVSPHELALLRPSDAFKHLGVAALLFGVGDATAEAVAAVGPAVRLVLAYRDPHFRPAGVSAADPYSRFTIAGRTVDFMTPREGSCNGHMEWIRQLRGMDDAVECLMLEGLDLSPADLSCLGHTLCNLKGEGRQLRAVHMCGSRHFSAFKCCCMNVPAASRHRRLLAINIDTCCTRADKAAQARTLSAELKLPDCMFPATTLPLLRCPTCCTRAIQLLYGA